jgi:benzoate/toluate 1,2-dioxygenase beta subunit
MPINAEQAHRINEFIQIEAMLLDERDWDAWLELYAPDCEYWVPMWDDDGEPTRDPEREMSLIYYRSRTGLEDRIARIKDGRSAATSPRFRTAHLRSAPVCDRQGGLLVARFAWVTHAFRMGRTISYFGRRSLWLRDDGDALRIVRSHALLANDLIDQVFDIYHL